MKAAMPVVVTGTWSFVGTTHCASQKYISLYHDGLFTQTSSKPTAYLGDGQVMTIAQGLGSYARIGDMVLSTNTCLVVSDFSTKQGGRATLASCLPGNNGFYDTCGSFALLFRPAFSGDVDLASVVTYPVTFHLDSAPYYYRATLSGQNFYTSGWARTSALSSTAILSLSANSPIDSLKLLGSTSGGMVTLEQTWFFQTTGPAGGQTAVCAVPPNNYVYFYMQMEESGANTVFTVCCQDHSACAVHTEAIVGLVAKLGSASGTFAQIPIYNALIVPYTVSPVLDAAFFTSLQNLVPLSVLDANCVWGSGPVCNGCLQGYYLSQNSCRRCHPNCNGCTGQGLNRCSACSSGYYAQPLHASICLPTCPTGYSASGQTCSKSAAGDVVSVDFLAHTAMDFIVSGQRVEVKYFYLPTGAYSLSGRGMFLNYTGVVNIDENSNTASGTLLLNTDFSYDIWMFPYGSSGLFKVLESIPSGPHTVDTKEVFELGFNTIEYPVPIDQPIYVKMGNYRQEALQQDSDFMNPVLNKQWVHMGVSVTYDSVMDQSSVVVLMDKQLSSQLIFPSFLVDTHFTNHTIGWMTSTEMMIAALTIVNSPRSLADFLAQLGSCPGCSVCPVSPGVCLPTCLPDEYIGPNMSCVKCKPECQFGCSTANSCSASTDPICSDWNSVTATCTKCFTGAVVVNGRCECENGKVLQGTECIASCSAGYYVSQGLCTACERGCQACSKTSCNTCSPEFLQIDGQCSCGPGWYIASNLTCVQCETPCLECHSGPQKCTKCAVDQGYFLFNATCVDCRSVPGYDNALGLLDADLTGLSAGERALKVCREICGDGISMGQYACDDGNLEDGDGCSHLCQLETGWNCAQDGCMDVSRPLPVLRYMNLTDFGYLLLLGFNETVHPIENLADLISVSIEYIDLFSFSLEPYSMPSDLFSTFQLSLNLDQSVPSGTEITVFVPNSLTDLSGNHLAATEANTTLQDSFISQTMIYLDLLMSGFIGILLAMLGTGLVMSVLMETRLEALWSLVEALQLANMLLYSGGQLPDNVRHYLRPFNFVNLAQVPCIFCSDLWTDYDRAPSAFGREHVSVSFLLNIGPILTLWWAVILAYICVLLAVWAAPGSKTLLKLKENCRYSLFLRLGIETSLQTALAVCLQLSDPLPKDTPDPLNLAATGLGVVVLAAMPLLVALKVTSKPSSKLKQEEHRLLYGSLYAGFKLSRRWKRSFLLFRLVRKAAWALVLVAFSTLPTVQAALLILISVLYLCALLVLRPFQERFLGTATHIAGLIVLILAQSVLLAISLEGYSVSTRNYLGWATVGLTSFYLLAYIAAFGVDLVLQILRRLSRLYQQYALEVMESMKLKEKPTGDLETSVIHTEIEEVQQQPEKVPRPLLRPRPPQRPKLKRVALAGRKK